MLNINKGKEKYDNFTFNCKQGVEITEAAESALYFDIKIVTGLHLEWIVAVKFELKSIRIQQVKCSKQNYQTDNITNMMYSI